MFSHIKGSSFVCGSGIYCGTEESNSNPGVEAGGGECDNTLIC